MVMMRWIFIATAMVCTWPLLCSKPIIVEAQEPPVIDLGQQNSPELVPQETGRMDYGGAAVFGASGRWLVTTDSQGMVLLYDLVGGRLSHRFDNVSGKALVAVHPTRDVLAVMFNGSAPASLILYDVNHGVILWKQTLSRQCEALHFSGDGSRLMGACLPPQRSPSNSVFSSGTLVGWQTETGAELKMPTFADGYAAGQIFSEDGRWVLAGRQMPVPNSSRSPFTAIKVYREYSKAIQDHALVDTETGQVIAHISGMVPMALSARAHTVVLMALPKSGAPGYVLEDVLNQAAKPIPLQVPYGGSPQVSADGRYFLISSPGDAARVDATTGTVERPRWGPLPYLSIGAMANDGDQVAFAQTGSVLLTRFSKPDEKRVVGSSEMASLGVDMQKLTAGGPTTVPAAKNDATAVQLPSPGGSLKEGLKDMIPVYGSIRESRKNKQQNEQSKKTQDMQAAANNTESQLDNQFGQQARQAMMKFGGPVAVPPVSAFLDGGRLMAIRTADGGWGVWDTATGNPLPFQLPLEDITRYEHSGNNPEDFLDAQDLQKIESDFGIAVAGGRTGGILMAPATNGTRVCSSIRRDSWVEVTRKDKKVVSAVLRHSDGRSVDLIAIGIDVSSFDLRSMMESIETESMSSLNSSSQEHVLPSGPFGGLETMCSLSPDGNRLIVERRNPEMKSARKAKINNYLSGVMGGLQTRLYGESMYGRMFTDSLIVYDTSNGHRLCELENETPAEPFDLQAGELVFSADNRRVTAGGTRKELVEQKRNLRVWDGSICKRLWSIQADSAQPIGFSEDSKLLYTRIEAPETGMQNPGVHVWDSVSGKRLFDLPEASMLLASAPGDRALIGPDRENTLGIWDRKTGERLGTMRPLQEREWLVTTPSGLFDGSPRAWQQITWRDSGGLATKPVEVFFSEFYRPGLLAELLEGRVPQPPRTIDQIDRRQPSIQISSDVATTADRTVKLRVVLAEASKGGPPVGVRDVRLFRNGLLVRVWRGELPLHDGAALLEATVPLISGENHFVAYAFNRDNVKSQDAQTLVECTGPPELRTAYIIAVGVNGYSNPEFNLKFAAPDAQHFGQVLATSLHGVGSVGRIVEVRLLDDDATKENLLRSLDVLSGRVPASGSPPALSGLKQARPGDMVFLYFAGHGLAWQDHFYLIPHDVGFEGPREELAGSLNEVLGHGISDLDLEKAFEGLDAASIVLVIDACNSGKMLDAEEARRGPMNSRGLAQLAYEKGMYVLTASQAFQAALESSKLGHGYLTYSLVDEGLETPRADTSPADGKVSVAEWFEFASRRVPEMQSEALNQASSAGGRQLKFETAVESPDQYHAAARSRLQTPRIYYRRDDQQFQAPIVYSYVVPQ